MLLTKQLLLLIVQHCQQFRSIKVHLLIEFKNNIQLIMATVTGYQGGGEDDTQFSKRGPAAGRFNPRGVMSQTSLTSSSTPSWFQGLLTTMGLGGSMGPQITGDIGKTGPIVTESGVGVNRNKVPVTSGAGTRLSRAGNQVAGGAAQMAGKFSSLPLARTAAIGTAGLLGAQQLAQGNPLGAVAETAGALGGGAVASALGAGLMATPGAVGIAARIGIPLAGSLIGGGLMGGITGAAKAKAEEPGAEPMYIPGTNIPLNQSAQYENLRNRDLAYNLKASKSQAEQDLTINRQYLADARNDQILREKAMIPLQEQINRSNLVNAQAMLASQTSAYQQLGRQAGMFKLASGAQAETGATLRTAISNNPYLGATLSAPNINFG